MRVLVVDDNQDAADMLGLYLKGEACEVTTATSGAAAIELALAHRPHLVLLDLSMPGIDGFRVAERLRTVPALRDIPIVAVSGHGEDDYRDRAGAAGFTAYLVKPVNEGVLREILHTQARSDAAFEV